ncbi:MAG: hypothetical protein M1546_08005 [Chloroflexi bacterium]|nr:hypothetical protein [Chloroflexota bacterium]
MAFDDTHANNRTLYLALSVVIMFLGALAHSRSRRRSVQMATLLAGMSLSLWMALLDQAYFKGGLVAWMTARSSWLVEIGWVVELWVDLVVLLLAPSFIGLARRTTAPAAPT